MFGVDDIAAVMAGIQLFQGLIGLLQGAHQALTLGQPLTPEQRAALDQANEIRKNRIVASIDAKIGPDPDAAPAAPSDGDPAPSPAPL